MTAKKPYDLSQAAARDLEEIFLYSLSEFGLQQAEAYRDELLSVLTIIGANPELARLRTEITPPVRVHPHGPHVLIYTLHEHRRPLILRIRDAREAWAGNRLFVG